MELEERQLALIKEFVNTVYDQGIGQFIAPSMKKGDIHFNDWVVIPPIFCTQPIMYLGRVVQVRTKSGAYGSDVFLVRTLDHNLVSWENQVLRVVENSDIEPFLLNGNFILLDEDDEEQTYTLCNKLPRKGFWIEETHS